MKVLCVGNGGVMLRNGEICTHAGDLAFLEELASIVSEVVFCGWLDSRGDPLSLVSLSGNAKIRGLALPRVDGSQFVRAGNALKALLSLSAEIIRADRVYIYWPGKVAEVAALICRFLHKPYGIYFRGELITSESGFARAFSGASFIIAAGQTLVDRARKYCPNVEAVTPMTAIRATHLTGAKRYTAAGAWRLLYVGRIERRKGSEDLISALAQLDALGVSAVATLVGHCADPDALLAAVPGSIAERVQLPGAVSDFEVLANYYRSSDIFVFPSHDEGFPRVLYEAMAFGLPILTTFVGSIPATMKDEVNCLRIQVADPTDIASQIRSVTGNPALYERISLGGHATVQRLMRGWRTSHAQQVAQFLGDRRKPERRSQSQPSSS